MAPMKTALATRNVFVVTVGLLASCLLGAASTAESGAEQAALELQKLSLTSLSDYPFESEDLTDQPVVIQFWASWCGSCGSVMWDMDKLLQQFLDARYLAVSTDSQIGPAREYARKHALFGTRPTSFVHDTDGQLARQFEIETVPTILIADQHGVIVHRHLGHLNSRDLQAIRATLDDLHPVAPVAVMNQTSEITDQ